MTISEYEHKDEDNDKYLVEVLHHKTSSFNGPAKLIIEHDINDMIILYYENIKRSINARNELLQARLFLMHTGNEFVKIFQPTSGM